LEKHGGSLLDYQTQLLQLVNNLTSSNSSKNEMQDMHLRESSLIKILQRLYDEATDDENNDAVNTCLDIWDKLLCSEVYSAINASKESEGGLLS
jgi:vacuolar-type H+-ATPase catalytic subunit A/Vma1